MGREHAGIPLRGGGGGGGGTLGYHLGEGGVHWDTI